MKPPILFTFVALGLAALVAYSGLTRPPVETATAQAAYPPGREPMTLPANYRETFALYAVVDRSDDVTRKIYISPAAVEAVRNGAPFPERTQIVIEAYAAARDRDGKPLRDDQGHLIAGTMQSGIHAAERRSTWLIEDLASSSHLGGWNLAAFDANTGEPNDEPLSDCFSCHDGAFRTDFVFTRAELARYAATGTAQYDYCGLPGRLRCR